MKYRQRILHVKCIMLRFTNVQGNVVSFDEYGNPKNAYYTVENIKLINGSYQYIPVGNWSSARNSSNKLQLDVDNIIQWPLWFQAGPEEDKYPSSRCNGDCEAWLTCCWETVMLLEMSKMLWEHLQQCDKCYVMYCMWT